MTTVLQPPIILALRIAGLALAISLTPVPAVAHATGQRFVALLPTGPYMAVGVLIVGLSMILLWRLPRRSVEQLLPSRDLGARAAPYWLRDGVSFLFFLLFGVLLVSGFTGTRDPLDHPLVLGFWVIFWMAAVMFQGLVADLWSWISPWRWLDRVMAASSWRPPLRLPRAAGIWPGVLALMIFAGFTLADPAPDDPARLAQVGIGYTVFTLAGCGLVGARRWCRQVELFSILMRLIGRLAPLARRGRRLRLGWPGWQLAGGAGGGRGVAVFILVLLGVGSFDGLNETFTWLDLIGVNPLAYPGRTAVVVPVLAGLVTVVALLLAGFRLISVGGERLAGGRRSAGEAMAIFAPTVLPIALAYHIAHYLPSLLVDGQFALLLLNDPFGLGANWLGLEGYHVTTGFFNHRETMRVIWLTQAAAIVFGHVLAVILAHASAVQSYPDARRAFLAGLPLAVFMIFYTWLGLWLLAAPKGG